MTGQQMRQALRGGEYVFGTAIVGTDPKWCDGVAGVGLDFVFLDGEHQPLDRGLASWLCQTYRGLGLAPLLRIPSPDPYQACMALDGGACGILAPYIEHAEQVRQLVGAVRYRPVKGAKVDGLIRGEPLDPVLDAYLTERNRDHYLVINIESVPAMENLDEILAVPELDAVLIGPHDLSCSLDVPEQYDHPVFKDAVVQILSKSRAAGKGAGIHFWAGMELELEFARRTGANLIVHSNDRRAFVETMQREVRYLREQLTTGVRALKTVDLDV